jgi:D-sedoheptulose 7-phosphate isomerase
MSRPEIRDRTWVPTARLPVPRIAPTPPDPGSSRLAQHLAALAEALGCLTGEEDRLERWGSELARRLIGGARLLAVGNGGSASHAAHLTSELVGRYRRDRVPLAALSLAAEPCALTAIANDWSYDDVFARQVAAFGREGDVLMAFSTSGRSPNVLAAVGAARSAGMVSWAVTGAGPNPLAGLADDALLVPSPLTATVQEVHQVALHLLCESVDANLLDGSSPPDAEAPHGGAA